MISFLGHDPQNEGYPADRGIDNITKDLLSLVKRKPYLVSSFLGFDSADYDDLLVRAKERIDNIAEEIKLQGVEDQIITVSAAPSVNILSALAGDGGGGDLILSSDLSFLNISTIKRYNRILLNGYKIIMPAGGNPLVIYAQVIDLGNGGSIECRRSTGGATAAPQNSNLKGGDGGGSLFIFARKIIGSGTIGSFGEDGSSGIFVTPQGASAYDNGGASNGSPGYRASMEGVTYGTQAGGGGGHSNTYGTQGAGGDPASSILNDLKNVTFGQMHRLILSMANSSQDVLMRPSYSGSSSVRPALAGGSGGGGGGAHIVGPDAGLSSHLANSHCSGSSGGGGGAGIYAPGGKGGRGGRGLNYSPPLPPREDWILAGQGGAGGGGGGYLFIFTDDIADSVTLSCAGGKGGYGGGTGRGVFETKLGAPSGGGGGGGGVIVALVPSRYNGLISVAGGSGMGKHPDCNGRLEDFINGEDGSPGLIIRCNIDK